MATNNLHIEIERHAERREVMIHFLAIEEERSLDNYKDKSTAELEKIVESRCFNNGTNPFGVYLVGNGSDRRNEDIEERVLGLVRGEDLYSCGVDERWNPCLQENKGNLLDVVHGNPYLPIDNQRTLSETSKIIVTVNQSTGEKKGHLEVIDGFHRAIRLIQEGTSSLKSYIGLFRPTRLPALGSESA